MLYSRTQKAEALHELLNLGYYKRLDIVGQTFDGFSRVVEGVEDELAHGNDGVHELVHYSPQRGRYYPELLGAAFRPLEVLN